MLQFLSQISFPTILNRTHDITINSINCMQHVHLLFILDDAHEACDAVL